MEELRIEINNKYADFFTDMTKALNGNKSAAVRSRRLSLDLEKLLKEYRKASIAAAKV